MPLRRIPTSFRIGSLLGIEVRLHVTFVLLYAVLLAEVWRADGAAPARALAGRFLLLFLCVLLHELGHSVVARRYGLTVRDILLWPLGGIARLERLPESTRAELWIALAGPAVNFALVAVIVLCGFVFDVPLAFSDPVTSWLSWPQWALLVNLAMGTFNLIPAFPLDGGRVLRALLAQRLGAVRATCAAVFVGRLFASVAVVIALSEPQYLSLGLLAIFVWWLGGLELAATFHRASLASRAALTPETHGIVAPKVVVSRSEVQSETAPWQNTPP